MMRNMPKTQNVVTHCAVNQCRNDIGAKPFEVVGILPSHSDGQIFLLHAYGKINKHRAVIFCASLL